jgi:hypothetical protein
MEHLSLYAIRKNALISRPANFSMRKVSAKVFRNWRSLVR